LKINSNRNLSSIARSNRTVNAKSLDERRARTRTLIQAGGLLNLSGLLEYCDIEEGEDLQYDLESRDKAALLLGILSETLQKLLDKPDPIQIEKYKKLGTVLMKQSSARTSYEKLKPFS
jgi:hypothetical protein